MTAKIYYLNLARTQETGELGFIEPDVSRLGRGNPPLTKRAQVGTRKKAKYPFPCNRDRAWKKPINGDAVRRVKKGTL